MNDTLNYKIVDIRPEQQYNHGGRLPKAVHLDPKLVINSLMWFNHLLDYFELTSFFFVKGRKWWVVAVHYSIE